MATYEEIAASVAEISAAVAATTTAVTAYVAGDMATAEAAYATAANYVYGTTNASLSTADSSANSATNSVNSSLSIVQDETGRWVVVTEDDVLAPINDSLFAFDNDYNQIVNYVTQTTDTTLDQTEGILSGIEGWIADAIRGAIAGVEDLLRPILLTVETALVLLGDTMAEVVEKITSIPEMITKNLTELFSIDEDKIGGYVKIMKKIQDAIQREISKGA